MAQRAFDITVNVDTKQADRSLNKFQKELKETQKDLQNVGKNSTKNLTKFNKEITATQKKLGKIKGGLGNLNADFSSFGEAANDASSSVGGLDNGMLDLVQTAAIMQNQFKEMFTVLGKGQLEFQKMPKVVKFTEAEMAKMGKTLPNVEAAQKKLNAANIGAISLSKKQKAALEEIITGNEAVAKAQQFVNSTQVKMNDAVNKNNASFAKQQKVLLGVKIAIVAVAAAAIVAAAGMAKLLQQTITLSGLDSTEFQKFAIATSQFGINAEQAANIIKDFNDKIGDFIITGQGPLIDVMERLGKETGLTTEALVAMSGPDALVALKTAMDQANLSTQEQVFLFESLGSDLSLLIPLFEKNGAALKDVSTEFDTLNAVVSQGTLDTLVGLSNEWADTVNLVKAAFLGLASIVSPILEGILAIFNKLVGAGIQLGRALNFATKAAAASLADLFGDTDGAEQLRKEMQEVFNLMNGITTASGKAADNVARLRALQDNRASKQLKIGKDLIANQIDLAGAVQQSTAAYEQELFMQTRIAKQEAKRKELATAGLRPQQIQDIIDKYDILEIAIQHTNDELGRRTSIEGFNKSLENQLELLRARNEEERRFLELNQQIGDTALSPAERAKLEGLQAQIIAQEKLNQLLIEQKEAWIDLGSSVTSFALGSKAALAEVIKQLIILANLQFFGGNNPFLQSFAGGIRGFASGGNFNAGETFMVGERGPEIITSSAPGSVIPNHALGGGGDSNMSFSFNVGGSINGVDDLDRRFSEFATAIAENTNGLLRNQLRTGGVLA